MRGRVREGEDEAVPSIASCSIGEAGDSSLAPSPSAVSPPDESLMGVGGNLFLV